MYWFTNDTDSKEKKVNPFEKKQEEIFEKFHDCWDEYVSLAEAPSSSMHSD